MKTNRRDVPLRALRFAADVAMSDSNAKGNVPLTIKARSGKPVTHWWWGPVIHDLSGFQSKASVPLDYCHDADEVIGFANRFDVSSGDLIVSGFLVPFADGDRASEIVDKAGRGVPYEASIYFDESNLTVEEVPQGVTVNVNGADYVGPLSVVRQWTLRGVAVCPYGTDAQTSVEFSAKRDRSTVKVRQFRTELSADRKRLNLLLPPGLAAFAAGVRFAKPVNPLSGK